MTEFEAKQLDGWKEIDSIVSKFDYKLEYKHFFGDDYFLISSLYLPDQTGYTVIEFRLDILIYYDINNFLTVFEKQLAVEIIQFDKFVIKCEKYPDSYGYYIRNGYVSNYTDDVETMKDIIIDIKTHIRQEKIRKILSEL